MYILLFVPADRLSPSGVRRSEGYCLISRIYRHFFAWELCETPPSPSPPVREAAQLVGLQQRWGSGAEVVEGLCLDYYNVPLMYHTNNAGMGWVNKSDCHL